MSGGVVAAWKRLAQTFVAQPRRSRLLIMAAGAGILLLLADQLWLTPQVKAVKAAQLRHVQLEQESVALAARTSELVARLDDRTLAALAAKHVELEAEITRVRAEIEPLRGLLLPPQRLPELLRTVTLQQGLELLELKSLPAEPVSVAAADTTNAPAPADEDNPAVAGQTTSVLLYRHAFQVRLRGQFAQLITWLQVLEQGHPELKWRALSVQNVLPVQQAPELALRQRQGVEMTFEAYTFSIYDYPLQIPR